MYLNSFLISSKAADFPASSNYHSIDLACDKIHVIADAGHDQDDKTDAMSLQPSRASCWHLIFLWWGVLFTSCAGQTLQIF